MGRRRRERKGIGGREGKGDEQEQDEMGEIEAVHGEGNERACREERMRKGVDEGGMVGRSKVNVCDLGKRRAERGGWEGRK